MLQDLFDIHRRVISGLTANFVRTAYDAIRWDSRLVGIVGARGTGKTTLVLQHYLERYQSVEKCLYVSADNPLVLKYGIYNIAVEYFKYYGECMIIDEIHKQDGWSEEIKALYDAYPDKKFIALGSSILNILQSKGDLSRRMVIHHLPGLSFREYLNIRHKTSFPVYTFKQIRDQHVSISESILSQRKTLLRDFEEYCRGGFYPFCIHHTEDEYFQLLANVLDKVIYEDIPSLKALRSTSSLKLKKLVAYLSASKIPQISVGSLTNELGVARDTLYEYLDLLERAEIIQMIRPISANVRTYKRSKIFFSTPNFYFSIQQHLWSSRLERGNVRESFFSSQASIGNTIYVSDQADFLLEVEGEMYDIEVGGPNKDNRQIKDAANGLVFKDGIEIGFSRQIPLYLAGFLY